MIPDYIQLKPNVLALAQKGVTPAQVDFNIFTHGHPDHVGNLNLFTAGSLHMSPNTVFKFNTICGHPAGQSFGVMHNGVRYVMKF